MYVMIDIEADGPIPGDFSMISLGAVIVEPGLSRTFYGTFKPISDKWSPTALAVSKFTREETLLFPEAAMEMARLNDWVRTNTAQGQRAMFVSDNNGFDWSFTNWYFHHFTGDNPFGHSSTNLGSLYKGITRDMHNNFKKLRPTKHTHNALEDALANAGAMLTIKAKYAIKGLLP